MDDAYRTLKSPAEQTLRVEGSRFIARAYPVASATAAKVHVDTWRSKEHDATHHCSAYRIDADRFHYDDDGEPSRTAGPPILQQIDARELVQTLVIVTRYYGGTKLGTGGLIRAYGQAAGDVLDAAPLVTRVHRSTLEVRFAYDDTGPARQLIDQFDAIVEESQYDEQATLTIAVRRGSVAAFREAFKNHLGGRGDLQFPE